MAGGPLGRLPLMRTRTEPEPPARFMRVCPYCHRPLAWMLFGRDAAVERPRCPAHGPLRLWRVVDWLFATGPAIVSVGHVSEDVCGRMLATPLPLRGSRRASARWKLATRTFRDSTQPHLLSIDLAHLALPPEAVRPAGIELESRHRELGPTCSMLKPVTEEEAIARLIERGTLGCDGGWDGTDYWNTPWNKAA